MSEGKNIGKITFDVFEILVREWNPDAGMTRYVMQISPREDKDDLTFTYLSNEATYLNRAIDNWIYKLIALQKQIEAHELIRKANGL